MQLNSQFGKAYFLSSQIKFALGENESACFDIKEGLLFEVSDKYVALGEKNKMHIAGSFCW